MTWYDNFKDDHTARIQCKALNIDYEAERPDLSGRRRELFNAFSRLNRRRIEHRPLQLNDIMSEIEGMRYPDKCLEVIENVDSEWLRIEAEKIKRRNR